MRVVANTLCHIDDALHAWGVSDVPCHQWLADKLQGHMEIPHPAHVLHPHMQETHSSIEH
jgi:hypothetical protein